MHKSNRNRSLADCRRYPLEISGADVADGEHSGQAGFQKMRGPSERPLRLGQIVRRQISPGLNESFRIQRDTTFEPARVGNGTRHQKDMFDVVRLYAPRTVVAPTDALQMAVSFQRQDFRLRSQLYAWALLQTPNQIAR